MPHVDHYRNGKRLVSATELTTIIGKPFLDKWRIKLCRCLTHAEAKKAPLKPAEQRAWERFGAGHCGNVYADLVKDDAGDLGTSVHDIIENWFKGHFLAVPSTEAALWAKGIIKLYGEHKVKPVIIKPEENLIDEESGLAGSPDTIGEWDGRVEILDTKIKGQLDDLTAMQGCAYRYLLKRCKGQDVRWMRPIWCQKESKDYSIKSDIVYDLDEWTDDWKALVRIWNRLHPNRKVTIHE